MTPEELNEIKEAAALSLRYNIPFAVYSLPGEAALHFMACESMMVADGVDIDAGECFFISRFGADEPCMAGVKPQFSARDIISLGRFDDTFGEESKELPYRMSTVKASWIRALKQVQKRLKKIGGKVVLSTHTTVYSTCPIVEVAIDYITRNILNFGYFCYTPQTGLWYGSTPELLLENKVGSNEFRTMALAGTRWSESGPWDSKNLAEHALVREFIACHLRSLYDTVEVGETETIYTNGVQHLMTPIAATGSCEFTKTLLELNPTPAVAGIPREIAMAEIDVFESHQRRCYAGVVGVNNGTVKAAYVNLRCAFAAPAVETATNRPVWVHNVYAGGGIMPDSDPETEWNELERKCHVLISVIQEHEPADAAPVDLLDVTFSSTPQPTLMPKE
ncbi:MAG: chorismate-binding protein [Muribaculaceae bacterium]|nr:chorismate-binding protein [Muribaculaceae bacterium]